MRRPTIVLRVALLGCLGWPLCCVLSADLGAAEGLTYYGMFGARTLGEPYAPRARTRLDSGLVRGSSGQFLGLSRQSRFQYDPSMLRSAIPDTLGPATAPPTAAASRPALPPAVWPSTPAIPPHPGDATIRVEPRPAQPAPLPDVWFRAPSRRVR